MDVVAYGGSDIPTMKNYVKNENILVSVAKEWDQKMKKGFRKLTPKWSYYWFTTVSMVSFDYEKKTALIAEPNNRIELIGQSNWPEYNRIRYYEFARFLWTSLSSFLLSLLCLSLFGAELRFLLPLVSWGRNMEDKQNWFAFHSSWARYVAKPTRIILRDGRSSKIKPPSARKLHSGDKSNTRNINRAEI